VQREQHLTLIDAGFHDDACWKALNEALQEHNLDLKDLTEIILTHHHIDHVGLVNRILDIHPIPIYTSPLSIPRLRRDQDFLELRMEYFSRLYREMGCGENGDKQISYLRKSIEKNKDSAIRGKIAAISEEYFLNYTVIDVPGHAPDQLAFLDEANNWIFAGDLLIEHISSNALVEPDDYGKRMPSLIQHVNSLKKLHSLHVDIVYSGHGSIIHKPNEIIEMRLKRTEEKLDKIQTLIKSGNRTGNELAQTMYRGKYEKEFSLVMSEIIGHLDFLEHENRIEKEFVNGVCHYYSK
jgi:glyoxylase-like metal-dependent hydrolase (beta-lactamase superfamily II)